MNCNTAGKTDRRERRVPVMLRGATVMEGFRESLFDAANRAGMTPNEFCLQAAAEKLKRAGRDFSGVFQPGDIAEVR
ncbi:hypothetical protein PY650_24440 [Rhizobium calliandrae]|uniref:Uncharacterized protein n=2 Tax=Rhizobium TaxID=379 RepID=A0ABT7KJC9_9HYPH|nr:MULTISPECIES: hypothetical protein [Rhizobium]MDL2401576.1 hypothetical protein [Rhizobium mayense]MDL2408733.1 hypothetical protein [Rhizobium calliandrae]